MNCPYTILFLTHTRLNEFTTRMRHVIKSANSHRTTDRLPLNAHVRTLRPEGASSSCVSKWPAYSSIKDNDWSLQV